jgi:hypothetical protein
MGGVELIITKKDVRTYGTPRVRSANVLWRATILIIRRLVEELLKEERIRAVYLDAVKARTLDSVARRRRI